MNTTTAQEKIRELSRLYGPDSSEYRKQITTILRSVWQAGYDFEREQQQQQSEYYVVRPRTSLNPENVFGPLASYEAVRVAESFVPPGIVTVRIGTEGESRDEQEGSGT